MNAKKRSITASLLLPATGVELLVVSQSRRERGFADHAFLFVPNLYHFHSSQIRLDTEYNVNMIAPLINISYS